MGGIAPEHASRVALSIWFRYRAAAEQTQASILLLTQHPCAKSSAELLLRLQPGSARRDEITHSPESRMRLKSRVGALRSSRQMSSRYASHRSAPPWRIGRAEPPGQVRDDKACRTVCLPLCKGISCAGIAAFEIGVARQAMCRHGGRATLEQVCSLTRKARILGLVHGMTRVEVDTFSAVTSMRRSYKEETATKTVLLECAGAFSPRVEDKNEDGAFLCVIDIAGTASLFGPPESLAGNLLTRVRALGITACIAVSRNFHAAIALAKGLPLRTSMKVIPAGEENAAIASLPLAVLDITKDQAETFGLWGICTLGMLAALPEKELVARMGQSGKRLRQLARGEMPHLFQPVEPVFTLEERMELDSPVELLEALLFVVNVMLEQIILRAKARVLALASVSIILNLGGGTTYTRTVRPALPTNDKPLWIKLLHLDLDAHPPQAAILTLSLAAEPGSTSKVQLGLFSPQLPEPARLDVTLAHIRAIVGDENVGRPVLRDTHQPGAFRMEPFTVPSGSSSVVPLFRPIRDGLVQRSTVDEFLARSANAKASSMSRQPQRSTLIWTPPWPIAVLVEEIMCVMSSRVRLSPFRG
jgi:protein ImuB